jgi:hypothetical protein
MRFYTVHVRPGRPGGDADLVLVREGFSWPAFLFGPLWALWHFLWLPLLAWLAAGLAVGFVADLFGAPADALIMLAFAVLVGLHANDTRRWVLGRHGYRFEAVVAAPDIEAATQRFLDSGALTLSRRSRPMPVLGLPG